MRKVHIIIVFLSLAWLFSCANKSSNPLIGKWASFSYDFGYSELSINDNTIQIFTHWMGNQGEWLYEVSNDSIKIQHGRITSYNVCYTKLLRIANAITNTQESLHLGKLLFTFTL